MRLALRTVQAKVGSGRSWTDGSGPWTWRFLNEADAVFGGQWQEVMVSGATLTAVALPPHAGEPCRGDRATLVGPEAPTVAAASARLAVARDDYRKLNPSCAGRIERAMAEPFSLLVLTSRPVASVGYSADAMSPAGLYVLDGFHRLLGWSLAGRLETHAAVPVIIGGPFTP